MTLLISIAKDVWGSRPTSSLIRRRYLSKFVPTTRQAKVLVRPLVGPRLSIDYDRFERPALQTNEGKRFVQYQSSCSLTGFNKRFLSSWKVAIVGSGPSGCYTAKYLQSAIEKGTVLQESAEENDKNMTNTCSIDILERLPTAYGLVRNGVAPDHPEVKNVQHDFDKLFSKIDNENDDDYDDDGTTTVEEQNKGENDIQFWGNVTVGKDISLRELREIYDVVILAYGCESDRELQLPNSNLQGILSAREFVNWYNGHIEYDWVGPIVREALEGTDGSTSSSTSNTDTDTDTTVPSIVVIGHGNVALDCARILAKTRQELDPTDIATRALDGLDDNGDDDDADSDGGHNTRRKKNIAIVGRRGHVQAAFTIKEIRELTKLPYATFSVREDELELGKSTNASQEELKASRPKTRIDKLLTDQILVKEKSEKSTSTTSVEEGDSTTAAQVQLRFLMNPIRFEPHPNDPTRIGYVVCERTQLTGEMGKQIAVGTGEEESFDANLALVSIGYKGVSIDGLEEWFDTTKGTIRHSHGLVDPATTTTTSKKNEKVDNNNDNGIDDIKNNDLAGLYVTGWLKRGPSGIIGTNIADAKDTVTTIIHDLEKNYTISNKNNNNTNNNINSTSNDSNNVDNDSTGNINNSRRQLDTVLQRRNVQVVDWDGYCRIDEVEMSAERKRHIDQPREKITNRDDLLRIASEGS